MAHKLLLADDSVTIQRVIELTFADEDITVTTVGDGQQAIDRLDADPPDIILADIDMPKRDGYEVATYVKSRPKLAHIPVVLLTGAFEPIDQARAAAAGSSDVLAKPFEPQMVINRVKELLGRKRPDEDGNVAPGETGSFAATQPQMGNPQPPGRHSSEDAAEPVSLDDYFDQLDAAFSNLQPGTQPVADGAADVDWPSLETPAAPVDAPVAAISAAPRPSAFAPAAQAAAPAAALTAEPMPAPDFVLSEGALLDKPIAIAPRAAVATTPSIEPVPPPAPVTPVAPAATIAPVAPVAPVAPIAPIAPVAPTVPAASVAPDAPIAPVAPVAPVAPAPKTTTANPFANLSAAKAEAAARPAAPAISDEVIEEIVSRVLQRMTDRVVRETVTDIVSHTAERLVQEEIERIKTGS